MDTAKIRQAGLYGLLGIVLSFLYPIPYIGFICGLAALVLIILSHKTIADEANEPEIFKNTILYIVLEFIAIVVATFIVGASIVAFANVHGGEAGMGVGMIFGMLIGYLGLVASFYFAKKVYMRLYEIFDIPQFKTAANLLFWGAVASILFGLGMLAVAVGWIFAAIGYNSLRNYEGRVVISQE